MSVKNLFFLFFSFSTLLLCAQKEIKLEDIFYENKFRQQTVSGFHSMNNGKYYTVLENSSKVIKYDYKNGKQIAELFSLSTTPIVGENVITGYVLSEAEDKILLTTSRKYIYRHSYISAHYIYSIAQKTLTPVFEKKQQLAKLSPEGGHVAFVVDNNLFVKNIKEGKTIQVTYDGKPGEIINGMPDWVYEEEFALKNAFDWSPDGRKLAFLRFDESHVKEFQMAVYKELYPEWKRFKYPKAGEENSTVSVHVFDMETGKISDMNTGTETDIYFPRIKWSGLSDKLGVVRLNRLQNKAEVLLCDALSGISNVIYTEENEKFVTEISDDFITFLKNGEQFIAFSEKTGYKHLYLYNINGAEMNPVTSGSWEVDALLGIDQVNKCVYYSSTEVSPKERHIYKVNFDGSGKVRLTEKAGVNKAKFTKSFDYFINYHSSANSVLNVTLNNKKGKVIRVLEDNDKLKKNAEEYSFVKQEFFSIKGAGGDSLLGYMFKPSDFTPGKKYPVLIYVYGGPGSQLVRDEWNRRQAWFQLLTQKGYIVACVDNRGTGGRGEQFQKATYLQLGKLEVEDQIAAAEYLADMEYVDRSRIGMFGWSYGGFMVLNCLMQGSHIFKMGIAVAPVTSWRFYDTIYTERYMRKPQDNSEGYDNNSPLSHVAKLKGKLLLVHGSGDDNVHFQNSMMITEELVQKNKQFDMMFYPNKNHGIYGGNTSYHLYTKMTRFVLENL